MPKFLKDKREELVDNYELLKSKAINLNSDISASRRKLRDSEDRLSDMEDKIDNLKDNRKVQSQAVEILKEVIDKMSRDHIEKVEDLVTFGLQTIFYDRDYALKIEVTEKRNNKAAELYILESRDGEVIKCTEDEVGGGVRVVIGFILQVFYIQYFEQNRVIFADEAFSELSDSYIDGLMEFINQLAEKRGFKIVLISHDNRLTPNADRVYRVEKGEVSLEKEGED